MNSTIFTPAINYLLRNDENWCKAMGYFNPYLDPFKNHLRGSIPIYDLNSYRMYPNHNKVYDKLWVAQSQNLPSGELENLFTRNDKINYPIFIKPRWGHLSAASKNCFKINDFNELSKYKNFKHMMWSEFVDGREGMTDFIILGGNIMHQVTYVYSEKQNGFTDEYKYISSTSQAPKIITDWVRNHLRDYTGIVNVQYRNDTIIEVGLRLARSGAYIIATDNYSILTNIYNVIDKNTWDYALNDDMHFKPYYAFKCYTKMPIIYIWPQHILDVIVRSQASRPFYEYYFEPVGNEGMVFLQFMHDNLEEGMKIKKRIEWLFVLTQICTIILFILTILVLFSKFKYKYIFVIIMILIYLTRYLNPFNTTYTLYKGQRQSIFGSGPPIGPDEITA
tara:strand:+ start:1148 stop:2323 length:1176 start_codon:yes stop_codon:yes gene_type:complete